MYVKYDYEYVCMMNVWLGRRYGPWSP